MTTDEKIAKVRASLRTLARELASITGQTRVADVASDAADELPDSSCLRLYEILTEH